MTEMNHIVQVRDRTRKNAVVQSIICSTETLAEYAATVVRSELEQGVVKTLAELGKRVKFIRMTSTMEADRLEFIKLNQLVPYREDYHNVAVFLASDFQNRKTRIQEVKGAKGIEWCALDEAEEPVPLKGGKWSIKPRLQTVMALLVLNSTTADKFQFRFIEPDFSFVVEIQPFPINPSETVVRTKTRELI